MEVIMMSDTEITRIITALGNGKDAYYVYMLCENIDGIPKPFYIGKGIKNRIFQHEIGAEQELKERTKEIVENPNTSPDEKEKLLVLLKDEISKKHKKINVLGTDNVIKIIVKYGLTEDEAFMAESALINAYSLTNGRDSLTNIVNGHMSIREKENVSCSTKARTLEDFLDNCASEEKSAIDIDEPVLFLKIKELYPKCMQLPDSQQEEAIYDSCRACWILNNNKIKKIKYVFALYNSQVVGIYSVNENSWKQRAQIDDTFPKFPQDARQPEFDYSIIAKNCKTLIEMKNSCKQHYDKFLKISKLDEDDESGFAAWKNRYYFNRITEEIPAKIASFKNCILVKPNGNKFFSEKGNRSEKMYNFDLVKGETVIKTEY